MAERTLLVVDPQPLYREALVRALAGRIGIAVVAAADRRQAEEVLSMGIAALLSERRLPDGDGLDLVARAARAGTVAGLLTDPVGPHLCGAVRDAGGSACLSKARDGDTIAHAVRLLLARGTAFDGDAPDAPRPLTQRRRDIVRLASEGWCDKRICSHLAITPSGVRGHWHHIFGRLGANNRTEAVTKALRLRII